MRETFRHWAKVTWIRLAILGTLLSWDGLDVVTLSRPAFLLTLPNDASNLRLFWRKAGCEDA
jgi:hypothetical protein